MKRILILSLLAILSLSSLLSCKKETPDEKDKISILIYAAGNNTLSSYVDDLIYQLENGFLPEKYTNDNMVLLYCHRSGEQPTLLKVTKNDDGTGIDATIIAVYDKETNSATAHQLNRVLRDAKAICPAKHRGLVLWSHGTGYLPEGYTRHLPDKRSAFGCDNNDLDREIEIQDIAASLPEKYEYIIFDACLMGSIEVAYELKDVCNYVLFSPTEIEGKGFPYYMMMYQIFNEPDQEYALTRIAEEYYNYYLKRYQSTHWNGGTITLVRTSKLEALADVCKPLFEKYRSEILSLDPNLLQNFWRKDVCDWHWFYDFGDIIERVATVDEYDGFKQALQETIVYKNATPRFRSILINKYSGYGMYLPDEDNTTLNAYYKNLKWNQATGLL